MEEAFKGATIVEKDKESPDESKVEDKEFEPKVAKYPD